MPALSVDLRAKIVSIQVEVVDSPLNYNILLGINWFYAMSVVALTMFRTLQFPHVGIIVTINQLDFCTPDVTTPMKSNVPFLGQSPPPYQSIWVGMLKDSALMGMFPSAPSSTKMTTVNTISWFSYDPKGKQVVDTSSLNPHEAVYDAIQFVSNVPTDDLHLVASYPYHLSYWLKPSLPTPDYIS